jgi:hypothetical protein
LSETPREENHFLGKILNIKPLGMLLRVTIDIKGLKLDAVISKEKASFLQTKENIWICFSSDALHPLCGRCHRLPPHLRKCNTKAVL